MPKFACKCGNVLNLSGVWPECEWRLVPMEKIGDIADVLDAGKMPNGSQFYDQIDEMGIVVYRWPICDRLNLESHNHTFQSYKKEEQLLIFFSR